MDRRAFLARILASGSFLLLEGACGSDGGSSAGGITSAASQAVTVKSSLPTTTTTTSSTAAATVPVNPFPGLPTQVWDQGMGATDASGLVVAFPLRPTGAVQVWANTAIGAATYNGRSPYPGYRLNGSGPNYQVGATGRGAADSAFGPKDSFANAIASVSPTPTIGEGNQFFFAEGQTFTVDAQAGNYYYGYSSTFPVCFQSYDPADPLNMAKHGRAGTGKQGARPVWQAGSASFPMLSRGDAHDYGNWVFRGIKATGDTNQTFSFNYSANNMLFENMIFDNVGLVIQNRNPIAGFTTSSNVIIRRVASYGQGVFSYSVNLTIEDSVWWHCGWKVGANRDDATGGANMFSHCLYIANGHGTTALIRRNICVDGSAAGLSLRGNHKCYHNVIIDCPTPDFSSGGSGSDTENPDGVLQQSCSQLVMGGADITSALPRGQGFSSSDGTKDSFYNYCLYVNNPKFGAVNNQWLSVASTVAAQPSYMNFQGNRAYAFAPASRRMVKTVLGTGVVANINILSDIENITTDTSPMTNAQIYAAAGYASKDAIVAAMIADPTQDWAYKLLSAAGTGFNFDFSRVV